MDHIAPLVILGLACAFLGWAVVRIAARFERQRQERHAEMSSDPPIAESASPVLSRPWIRFLRRWLLP
jgi:hypothetical protein